MKLFLVITLCVAAALAFLPPNLAGLDVDELQHIIDAINHPSTDPATAAALEQMLHDLLGITQPETVVPEENEIQPIEVHPEIIDESIIAEPANYPEPPLVQVILKVNANAPENTVVVEQPSPELIAPEEVNVVEQPEVPEPVQVAPIIIPEKPVEVPPAIVAPIQPTPVVNLPEILN